MEIKHIEKTSYGYDADLSNGMQISFFESDCSMDIWQKGLVTDSIDHKSILALKEIINIYENFRHEGN